MVGDPARLPRRVHVPAEPPHTGAEAAAALDPPLDALLHLYMLNRGVLHDAVPHDGADVAGDDRGAGRPPHGGVREVAAELSGR